MAEKKKRQSISDQLKELRAMTEASRRRQKGENVTSDQVAKERQAKGIGESSKPSDKRKYVSPQGKEYYGPGGGSTPKAEPKPKPKPKPATTTTTSTTTRRNVTPPATETKPKPKPSKTEEEPKPKPKPKPKPTTRQFTPRPRRSSGGTPPAPTAANERTRIITTPRGGKRKILEKKDSSGQYIFVRYL